jgi:hypothetical protein
MLRSLESPETQSSLHKPKAKWSAEEDEVLCQQVAQCGAANWNAIAVALPGRTGKQCRERWMSKLCPDFVADPWTPQEDAVLIRLQAENGNLWARVRGSLPGRSTTAIKNRWVSIKRKAARDKGECCEPWGRVPSPWPQNAEQGGAAKETSAMKCVPFEDDMFMAFPYDEGFFGTFE